MSYTRQDVDAVQTAIAAAVPEARFFRNNYDYDLAVSIGDPFETGVWHIFRHVKDEEGKSHLACSATLDDVPKIVERLRQ